MSSDNNLQEMEAGTTQSKTAVNANAAAAVDAASSILDSMSAAASSNFLNKSFISGLAPHRFEFAKSTIVCSYGPQKTSGLPAATEVHAVIASPILPAPLLLTNTVEEPVVIGAAWEGQGVGGKR